MKLFHIVSLFILFSLGCSEVISNRQPSAVVKHVQSVNVALMIKNKVYESHTYCTGVWVDRTHILTAYHCVEKIAELTEADTDDLTGNKIYYSVNEDNLGIGKETAALHLATVKKADEDHDLALLEALGGAIPDHDIAELASSTPAVGERVYICGQVDEMFWTFFDGIVSSYRDSMPGREGQFIQVASPTWHGNSGGGLFDTSGKLVGIASFITNKEHAPIMGFFVHAETVRKFLQEEDKKDMNKELKRIFTLPAE